MPSKKEVIIQTNLSANEADALFAICKQKDMLPSAVLRQAFRMYQTIECLMAEQQATSLSDVDLRKLKHPQYGCVVEDE